MGDICMGVEDEGNWGVDDEDVKGNLSEILMFVGMFESFIICENFVFVMIVFNIKKEEFIM